MANNYLQFSQTLLLASKEEMEFWNDALTIIPSLLQNFHLGEDTPEARDKMLHDLLVKFGVVFSEDIFDDGSLGFEHEISYSEDNSSNNEIWFYCKEYGNTEFLGCLVQAFFNKFRKDGFFYVTYAESCSKMRVDEFSGGAMVVTADEIKYHHVFEFVKQEEAKHNNKLRYY
jgi:hypothetical protein